MLYQRSPLPGRHEYFLDGALEAEEINSLAHAALTLLGDRQTISEIVDVPGTGLWLLRERWAICDRLDAYAHQIVGDLTREEQQSFAAFGLLREPHKLLGLAEVLANFNFEDETCGGALQPYRRWIRCKPDYSPTPRARRRLYAPAAIRRYVRLEGQSVPRACALAAGLRRLPAADPADAHLVSALLHEQREQHRDAYLEERLSFENEQRGRWHSLLTGGRGIGRQDRKAVQRAARFAAGVVGADQVSTFARGGAVRLCGREIDLQVARSRSIASVGHGALDVQVLDPKGTRLANLCVYFEKTPAIDQLAAIALHVQAGSEMEIMQTGNLFNVTADGANHPLTAGKLATRSADDRAIVDVEAAARRLRPTDHERRWIARETYWNQTSAIYYSAVEVQVWGRDARRLSSFKEALKAAGWRDDGRL
ncbi:hypothetical protein OOZ54_12470 [Rhodopseudomonas palustris]|uniref:hypothetical protein n=1 Tax=Rhodopseudomonas palustris TaxID=1076 RepID=UPI0022F09A4E|nr:hypothetical protein [Rhodopseudomonas palustris]WBU27508.1 hypothetical protein OOZ54_12470 [Rhodopseudomonas palustris]